MCGRYSQTKQIDDLIARFGFRRPSFELKPRYNLAPSQDAPVIIREDEGDYTELAMLRWGLIPFWTKELSGDGLINAKSETVAEKPSFRRSFQKQRCLVVVDSFFEWQAIPGAKRKLPMRIKLKNDEPFAMAGIYDRWKSPDGKEIKSFAIITTTPNRIMQPIHSRMPVLLKRQDEAAWLDPSVQDKDKLLKLLVPYPDEDAMEAYAVSTAVNSPANDKPECLAKVKP